MSDGSALDVFGAPVVRSEVGSFRHGGGHEKCLHAGAVFQYNTSKMNGRRTRHSRPFYLCARSKRTRFSIF